MNKTQTGSTEAIRPPGFRGAHRAPSRGFGWRGVLAALGVGALTALGSCSTPAPAAPVVHNQPQK